MIKQSKNNKEFYTIHTPHIICVVEKEMSYMKLSHAVTCNMAE
jgi:hypothetical protein